MCQSIRNREGAGKRTLSGIGCSELLLDSFLADLGDLSELALEPTSLDGCFPKVFFLPKSWLLLFVAPVLFLTRRQELLMVITVFSFSDAPVCFRV